MDTFVSRGIRLVGEAGTGGLCGLGRAGCYQAQAGVDVLEPVAAVAEAGRSPQLVGESGVARRHHGRGLDDSSGDQAQVSVDVGSGSPTGLGG